MNLDVKNTGCRDAAEDHSEMILEKRGLGTESVGKVFFLN